MRSLTEFPYRPANTGWHREVCQWWHEAYYYLASATQVSKLQYYKLLTASICVLYCCVFPTLLKHYEAMNSTNNPDCSCREMLPYQVYTSLATSQGSFPPPPALHCFTLCCKPGSTNSCIWNAFLGSSQGCRQNHSAGCFFLNISFINKIPS